MKKLFWFLFITIVMLGLFLVFTNLLSIWKAVLSFPIDRVVCYLLGAASMYIAGLFTGEKTFKSRKDTDE